MLKYQTIIRRFCHHHSRDIFSMPKLSNPLVECEYKCNKKKPEIQQTKTLPILFRIFGEQLVLSTIKMFWRKFSRKGLSKI
jgi:hypothetical protein